MTAKIESLDLLSLSEGELKSLSGRIAQAQIQRERQIREDAKRDIKAILQKSGLTLAELFGKAAAKGAKGKNPKDVKYTNPANPSQTWSGRGRRPAWFKPEALTANSAPAAETKLTAKRAAKNSAAKKPASKAKAKKATAKKSPAKKGK